jgi:tetratricopeptide (TPR) repeat protein
MPARPTADPPAPRGGVPLLWPAVALVAAVTVGLGIGGLPVLPPPPEESGEAPAAGGGWRPTPVGAEDAEEAVRLFREGNALFQQGDVLQAKALFERAVATDPGHAFSWANLGNVARELGETDRAIGCHERAFQLTATRPRSSYNLAVSLQTAGRYQPAAVMYQKAITLEREGHGELDVSRAYTNLGVCFQGLGQLEDAVEQYALAKQLRPDLRSANLNYCNIMLPLKGSDAAVGCFSSLLDRDPEFEQATHFGTYAYALGHAPSVSIGLFCHMNRSLLACTHTPGSPPYLSRPLLPYEQVSFDTYAGLF